LPGHSPGQVVGCIQCPDYSSVFAIPAWRTQQRVTLEPRRSQPVGHARRIQNASHEALSTDRRYFCMMYRLLVGPFTLSLSPSLYLLSKLMLIVTTLGHWFNGSRCTSHLYIICTLSYRSIHTSFYLIIPLFLVITHAHVLKRFSLQAVRVLSEQTEIKQMKLCL